MPAALLRRLALCLAIALPGLVVRVVGLRPDPLLDLLVLGAAIVAAAFVLAWAAEAARTEISGALAIALLALIAVLPEYAVDLSYAFRSGSDPTFEQYAAANMTGSNRLLLGFGWPLVVIVALVVARRAARARGDRAPSFLPIPAGGRTDLGFLAVLALVAFAIPLMGSIPLWFGIGLVIVFGLYLWRAGQAEDDDDAPLVGAAALIGGMPRRARRVTVIALFVASAAVILAVAEPFADALVEAGGSLGIDSFLLVQWLAPLASEAPEFLIAVMFAARGLGGAAIGTLIAAKVNQWSLLVGSLPIAHVLGGGEAGLALDARQTEEFLLTATQTVMGVAVIMALRFHWWSALGFAAIFAVQLVVTDTEGRTVLSLVQLALAAVALVVHRRDVLPTLAAPFRRPGGAAGASARTPAPDRVDA